MKPRNSAAGWENSHPQREQKGKTAWKKTGDGVFLILFFSVELLLSYLGEPKVKIVYS